jgi:predicted Zn-dependent protease
MAALGVEAEGDDPRAVVAALEKEVGQTIDVEEISIGDRTALRWRGTGRGRGGRLYYESSWVAIDGRVIRLIAICEERQAEVWRPTFDALLQSLAPSSPAELATIRQSRLRSIPASAGESAAGIAARSGSSWTAEQIEVANGVGSGHHFEAGVLVKISRSESYEQRPR